LIRELLERGDRNGAFDVMRREYSSFLYSLALRVLANTSLAQDALQVTFMQALRDLHTFRGSSPIRSWLRKICSNRAIDLARQERRNGQTNVPLELAEEEPEASPDPSLSLDRERLKRSLEGCLLELSPEVRLVLLLRYQEDMSYEEISRDLREKPGTLQARVMRALPVLLRCLKAKGWDH
jgi:RNA polymerase sigma-70 factor (ECF subfamily)